MATLTLENFPDDLYAQLKARAVEHRRSLNREAILCLEEALSDRPPLPTAGTLARLRRARQRLGKVFLTDRDLTNVRSAGRA